MSMILNTKQLIDGLHERAQKVYEGGRFEIGDCTLMGQAADEIEQSRARIEALEAVLLGIVDQNMCYFDGFVERGCITHASVMDARAAIAREGEK